MQILCLAKSVELTSLNVNTQCEYCTPRLLETGTQARLLNHDAADPLNVLSPEKLVPEQTQDLHVQAG